MIEIAPGVFVRRHTELDLTLGLITGSGDSLVVDAGLDPVFARAARPSRIVLTHNHFDHVLATEAFLPCEVWAHEDCVVDGRVLDERAKYYDDPFEGTLVAPTHTFRESVTLDVGGRRVDLHHFGPAHTSHDVVVHVPDAGVVFAGDLVEEGAEPQAGPDATPSNWRAVLDRVLALGPRVVVPGHGNPVDARFVREMAIPAAT
ncbi:Glyoxylase, beta-lactamase superfamily II [Lentzea xinjiangensis]|uniref:Glyoxylase, beta-lactamase superfamily II n=1 Tax=Lentzea xinjiangensis TaxID=402600 RepID=A0A1H9TC55_9PSEU|nr:MBL fold metallo-hydrolase [Lentzea xinjiangensis]SER94696.1 Glyoxylase, beta-lactamase superfamily II [Lentzea xinjiangensis]